MRIDFLDIEIPENLISQWITDGETSDDIRYVEKQAIDYIRANSSWSGGTAILFNGDTLTQPAFGSNLTEYEEEGYYIG